MHRISEIKLTATFFYFMVTAVTDILFVVVVVDVVFITISSVAMTGLLLLSLTDRVKVVNVGFIVVFSAVI